MPYQNYNIQYVAPQSLEYLDKTLSGLQQKHENTIERASALKATIAALDLNEAEADYREGLIQGIDNALNSKDVEGFKGYAFDDVIKMSGDLASDKGLLGRLNAQKQYREFTEAVDKSTEFGQDVKDWSKANNQYYYDEANGGKWNPTVTPTKQIDLNTVAQMAMKYIIPQQGKYSSVRYYNEDGSISNTFNPNGTIGVFDTISGQWERVTEQQVRDAVSAVMKESPEVRASLEQDFEVAKWKDNNAKGKKGYIANPMLYNNDGTSKTITEYTEDIFAPFIRSQTYYRNYQQVTPNTSLFSSKGAIGSKSGNGSKEVPLSELLGSNIAMPGNKFIYDNTDYIDAQAIVTNLNGGYRQMLSKMSSFEGIDYDPAKINIRNIDATRQYLNELAKNNSQIKQEEINDFINEMQDDYRKNYSSITAMQELEQLDPKKASKAKLYAGLSNGQNFKYDNDGIDEKEITKVGEKINRMFYKGHIINAFRNDIEYKKTVQELTNQGFGDKITTGQLNDGTYYIKLNKENSNLIIPFISVVKNNTTKEQFGWDNNGKYNKYQYMGSGFIENGEYTASKPETLLNNSINNFVNYYNKLNEDSQIAKQEFIEESTVIPGANPLASQAYYYSNSMDATNTERNGYIKLAENIADQLTMTLRATDFSELDLYEYNKDTGYMEKIDTKRMKEVENAVKNNYEKYKPSYNTMVTNDSGKVRLQITCQDKNGNPITVVAASNKLRELNPALAQLEDDPEVQANNKLNRAKRSNIGVDIGFEKGNNIDEHYQLKSNNGVTFDLLCNGEVIHSNITNKTGKGMIMTFDYINNLSNMLHSKGYTEEIATNAIATVTELLKNTYGELSVFSKPYEQVAKDMLGI